MGLQYADREDWADEYLRDRAPSVPGLLRSRIEATPDEAAYAFLDASDSVVEVTWREAGRTFEGLAAGFVDLGIAPGERIAICAGTRYEWVVVNWGVMAAGAATTTVYPTSLASDVAHIVADSGSRIVVAENAVQVAKLRDRRAELPDVTHVVVIDAEGVDLDDWVLTLDDLAFRGRRLLEREPGAVEARSAALGPDDLATIIYTSGTMGAPKGAELTHGALVYEGAAVAATRAIASDDEQFLWLPLSHVFGNVMLVLAAAVGVRTSVDGRVDRIVENMVRFRPTFVAAAPRIFEKAYAKIHTTLTEAGGAQARIAAWAIDTGAHVAALREVGEEPGPALAARHALARRLVLGKIQERFGGRIRFFISGSARLDPELSRWFAAVGMPVLEGWGMSETSSATTVNRYRAGAHRHGTVGWPMPGTQLKIAEDGELLVKGPGVMRAYHNAPEATAAVFTEDGFFRTGDIAEVDGRGFVSITDRKKDLFKTSGGKYVAPASIETRFAALCPYVSRMVVVGDQRQYVSALIALDPDAITAWARERGIEGDYEAVVAAPQTRELVQGYVDRLNADLNRWETIKTFHVLGRDLTVERGDLTPSLKVRRRTVVQTFAKDVEGLYPRG